ncbi:MAG: nitroreductase family protein [Bacteroidaceae bacterium]|nr:nitroreductase family protein [Bacteroidaceae bacterium]
MKKNNVLLGLLLVAVAVGLVVLSLNSKEETETMSENAAINAIKQRTSVRSFTSQAVEPEKIETLLRAGMAAPSAVNKQPWHFIVVTKREQLDALADANPNAGFLKQAPLAIVVCGDLQKALPGDAQEYWIQDCSAATENILVAATGMGLGATWTGTYPRKERVEAARKVLNLPEHIIPLNTLVIGYPDGTVEPKDKWNVENISYETFGGNASENTAVTPTPETKKELHEVNGVASFRENPFTWFTGDGLLLGAGDKNSFNAMTIGWGALGNIWGAGTPTITVYVAPARYTYEFMEKTKYFTVMTFDQKHKQVLRYMGSHSGRDEDKGKALGLTTLYTENGTPYYAEAQEVYECEMIYHSPLDSKGFGEMPTKFYANFSAGVHHMYMGKVIRVLKK